MLEDVLSVGLMVALSGLPVALPPPLCRGRVVGQYDPKLDGTPSKRAIAEIQAHQETYATTDTAFRLGSLDSPDDTDGELTEAPVSSGGIHLTAHGVLEQGHDLWNDFVTIDTSCAANPDLSSSSSSSSSASASASSSGGSEAVSAVPGTFIPVE